MAAYRERELCGAGDGLAVQLAKNVAGLNPGCCGRATWDYGLYGWRIRLWIFRLGCVCRDDYQTDYAVARKIAARGGCDGLSRCNSGAREQCEAAKAGTKLHWSSGLRFEQVSTSDVR